MYFIRQTLALSVAAYCFYRTGEGYGWVLAGTMVVLALAVFYFILVPWVERRTRP